VTTFTGHGVTMHFAEGELTRRCGDCQLCCKLVPVANLGKAAGERCRYQKAGKGCTVYARLEVVSRSCRHWNCRWLVNDDTEALRRPDRAHYVIDMMPDFITIRNDETGQADHVEAIQVWVDPGYRDAHEDPALRDYLQRRAIENKVALIRWSNTDGAVLFPPQLSANKQWNLVFSDLRQEEHTFDQVVEALAGR
jgi:hypothetical protein